VNLLPFALSFARTHWRAALILAAALAIVVQTFRLSATQASLEAERAGRQSDRDTYARAQAEATSAALSAKLETEALNARKSQEADRRYADLSGQYRAAVLRYQAAQRASGSAHLPEPADATQGADGPGEGADVSFGSILIPQGDALICAENQARLEAAHEWAAGLAR
jgi:hypothetical protein